MELAVYDDDVRLGTGTNPAICRLTVSLSCSNPPKLVCFSKLFFLNNRDDDIYSIFDIYETAQRNCIAEYSACPS